MLDSEAYMLYAISQEGKDKGKCDCVIAVVHHSEVDGELSRLFPDDLITVDWQDACHKSAIATIQKGNTINETQIYVDALEVN